MDLNYKIQLALIKFFKKYGKYLGAIFIIWIIGFSINQILKRNPPKLTLSNTYTPNVAIMTDNKVPNSQEKEIKETLKKFTDYALAKNYDQAYNMLTDECKEFNYGNSLNNFKQRAEKIYQQGKVAKFQNYSNYRKRYIYKMTITDDILKTGTSGNYKTYNELLTVAKVGNEYKIADAGYIDRETAGYKNQDENIEVEVLSKDISYKTEQYNVKIKNKTDKYIIIADSSAASEVTIDVEGEIRNATNTDQQGIILYPGETITRSLNFYNYFDLGKRATKLSFNVVRILENFTGTEKNSSKLASKVYSFNIKLSK